MDGLKDSATTSKERSNDVLFQLVIEGVVHVFNRYASWQEAIAKQNSVESIGSEDELPQGNEVASDDDDALTLVDDMGPEGIRLQSWDELRHFGINVREDNLAFRISGLRYMSLAGLGAMCTSYNTDSLMIRGTFTASWRALTWFIGGPRFTHRGDQEGLEGPMAGTRMTRLDLITFARDFLLC